MSRLVQLVDWFFKAKTEKPKKSEVIFIDGFEDASDYEKEIAKEIVRTASKQSNFDGMNTTEKANLIATDTNKVWAEMGLTCDVCFISSLSLCMAVMEQIQHHCEPREFEDMRRVAIQNIRDVGLMTMKETIILN
jgi:hypothetical protein